MLMCSSLICGRESVGSAKICHGAVEQSGHLSRAAHCCGGGAALRCVVFFILFGSCPLDCVSSLFSFRPNDAAVFSAFLWSPPFKSSIRGLSFHLNLVILHPAVVHAPHLSLPLSVLSVLFFFLLPAGTVHYDRQHDE